MITSFFRSTATFSALMLPAALVGLACSSNDPAPPPVVAGGANAPGASGGPSGGGATGATGGSGMFLPGGGSGGDQSSGSGGTIDIGDRPPNAIDECPGPLDGGQVSMLQGAGNGQGHFLYPYDGTVFPRDLLPPTLQWEGGSAADAVYVRMQSAQFSYQGCFSGRSAPFQLPLPELAWRAAGEWSGGAGDPLTVSITMLAGGQVIGPITQQWTFALARLQGAIYYNTYNSPIANNNGAIMKIVPGQATPQAFLTEPFGIPGTGPCVSCHALSADGSTMAVNSHTYPILYESRSYDVTAQNATLIRGGIPEAGFAGVFPDGSRAMTNGPPFASTSFFFPYAPGNVPALIGPAESQLLDLATGGTIAAGGWDVRHAQMPMFSPDGRHLVYNDHDQGAGHALWVADFDATTNTFSNKHEIFRHATEYPGWPFFTPDSKAVIFALGTRQDFVSQVPNPLTIVPPDAVGRSHLEIVYLATPGQSTPLDATSGYSADGQVYVRLPSIPPPNSLEPAATNEVDFFPTVSPVAAGGYFWVFFTSRRAYGNVWPHWVEDAPSKKIWVAAVNIQGQPGTDPSHPAFLLPGQELESGNLRAFAALEPCKEDGGSCTSGIQCCSGFCIDGTCQPPRMCAALDDACESSGDCCDESHVCIGGFCALDRPR